MFIALRCRPAVSLVEVLVALVILSVAALGSAATIGYSAHLQRRAAALREAHSVLRVQAVLLEAAPCATLRSDSTRVGVVRVRWDVASHDGYRAVRLTASAMGVDVELQTEVNCT